MNQCLVIMVVMALGSLTDVTQTLVIRHRSSHTPHSLTNAIHALERQKRHIGGYRSEYDDDLTPYDVYLSNPYKRTYDPENFSPSEFEYYPTVEDDAYLGYREIPNIRKDHKRSKSVPSKEELEAIFGSLSRASDRTKKRQISELRQPEATNEGIAKEKVKKEPQNSKLSESKLKEMLSEAEKDTPKTEQKREEKQEVNKEELKDIFSSSESDKMDKREADATKEMVKDEGKLSGDPTSKAEVRPESEAERFMELYNNLNQVTGVKRKRSDNQKYGADIEMSQTILDLTKRVARLEDDNARLRIIQALEDKENDLLASALKEATLAQLQGSDQYLEGEYSDIENAIRVEEVLQELKANKDVDFEGIVAEDDTAPASLVIPGGAVEQKRSQKPDQEIGAYEDTMGRWYDSPVDVGVQDQNDDGMI